MLKEFKEFSGNFQIVLASFSTLSHLSPAFPAFPLPMRRSETLVGGADAETRDCDAKSSESVPKGRKRRHARRKDVLYDGKNARIHSAIWEPVPRLIYIAHLSGSVRHNTPPRYLCNRQHANEYIICSLVDDKIESFVPPRRFCTASASSRIREIGQRTRCRIRYPSCKHDRVVC